MATDPLADFGAFVAERPRSSAPSWLHKTNYVVRMAGFLGLLSAILLASSVGVVVMAVLNFAAGQLQLAIYCLLLACGTIVQATTLRGLAYTLEILVDLHAVTRRTADAVGRISS